MLVASNDALKRIIGESLDSVTFVSNYVQLHFGERTLNAYNPPTVIVGEREYEWGGSGYADTLCGRLNTSVTHSSETDTAIAVGLSDGAKLVITVDDDGCEDAELSGPDGVYVWNGEEPNPP